MTRELQVLSENVKLFEKNNIALRISEPEQLKTANNKYSLMSFCRDNYIPIPDFYLVNSKDDFIKKSEMLGYPERQICFKPPVSNGLRGFRIISDSINRMNVIMNEKPNNVFIGFEEFLQIADESKWFPQLLLMEYLPGEEYSVDVLANRGKCIKVIPRLRDKLKMGISFVGTVVKEEQIIGYSGRLVERLGLDGNIGLQFRKDANGIPKIIESNPRLQGTVILCTAAGYNMVYNSVKLAVGEMPEEAELRWGTKMIRYWEELFVLNQKPFDLQ